jgi:hypothetical protein
MPLIFGWAHWLAQPAIKRQREKGDSHDEWNPMALMVGQRQMVQ